MKTLFHLMLKDTLSDKISLTYAVLFPLGLMVGIDFFIDSPHNSFLLPTVISISLLFWNLQGLAFQIFRQKSKGVYRLIKITPMNMTEFIAAMMAVRTLISIVINLFIFVIGIYILDISVSFLLVLQWLCIMLAASLCFSALGFFISNISKNEGQINAFSNLLYLPMVFCTEAFYSLQNAPSFISFIGKCLPFHYVIQSLQTTLDEQAASVLTYLLLILLFTFFFFILSLWTITGRNKFTILGTKVTSEK
ncbi:ABC transporter permease [Bacillus sp. AGMB 02131]|uniref:Transport permease protein n=1 Tax=Peribacillus faecalis TaxID=2772559 RepID=A0A927CYU3_9BACI|nr:ABC transporter permease [Peribacillus faecalis]MBD3108240.1 ABC transporter permease [Peribacillus faecalis]